MGYVGIGVSNPLQKLHVAGGAYIDGELTVTKFIKGTATKALLADKLTTGKKITFTGSVTGATGGFDGSTDISVALNIPSFLLILIEILLLFFPLEEA